MRRLAPLLLASLPIFTAQAGELGLFADRLQGSAKTDSSGNRFDAVSTSGFGVRGAYTLVNLKVAEIGITAAYRPETRDDLVIRTPGGAVERGRMGVSYGAVGVQVDWKLLVSIHAGLEMRHERLVWRDLASGNGSSTVDRPWARVGLGFSLPVPVLSPIIRLEFSAPLRREDSDLHASADAREALAPRAQAALYVGFRF